MSQATPTSIIKTNQLMLCRNVIAICSENYTKHISTVGKMGKTGGTYSNHLLLSFEPWKVKVKLFLCLKKALEPYAGVEVQLCTILIRR